MGMPVATVIQVTSASCPGPEHVLILTNHMPLSFPVFMSCEIRIASLWINLVPQHGEYHIANNIYPDACRSPKAYIKKSLVSMDILGLNFVRYSKFFDMINAKPHTRASAKRATELALKYQSPVRDTESCSKEPRYWCHQSLGWVTVGIFQKAGD